MTVLRRSLLAAALIVVILVVGLLWMIGTESGTRWLLDRAAAYLPAELQLGNARGSLLHGVEIESLGWHDAPTSLDTGKLFVHIQLVPLLRRHLIIDALEIDGVELRIGGGDQDQAEGALPAIELPIDVTLVALSLRRLSIVGDDFHRVIDEIAVSASLRGSDLQISELRVDSAWLDLGARGRLRLADNYPGNIEADWDWKDAGSGPFAGRLSIAGDTAGYALDHTLATPLAITSSGTVSYVSGLVDTDLTHEWASIEWPIERRNLFSSGGTLRFKGSPDAYSVQLDTRARIDDLPETLVRLVAEGNRQGIRVSSFAAQNPLGRVTATGDVGWLPEPAFDLEYSATGLDPAVLLDFVSGAIELEGSATGFVRDDAPLIDLAVNRVHGKINGHPVEGRGALRIEGSELTFSDTRLKIGSNNIRIGGRFGESLSLRAQIDVVEIAEILPDGAGSVRGTVSLNGPVDRPDVQLDLTGSTLRWREYSLASFSADGNLSAIKEGKAELTLERFTAGATELEAVQLSVAGRLGAHDVGVRLRALESDVTINAIGGYDKQSWIGQLASLTIDNDAVGRWATRAPSRVSASGQRVSLSRTCLFGPQESNELCVSGNRLARGPVEFDMTVAGVPVSMLPVSLPDSINLAGYLHANLKGKWENGRLTAESDVELREGALETVYDEDFVSIVVSQATSETTIVDNRVESVLHVDLAEGGATGTVRLSIEDLSDGRSAIAGRVDLSSSDVSSFAAIVPGVIRPRGKVAGNLAIAGTLDSPEFLGEVALTDASFGVRQSGIEVSELALTLTQLAPGQLRLVGQARSGEGRISVEGQTQIGADSGIRSEIRLFGENFELARLPNWQIAASPAISVVFDERATTVTGDLAIPTARIRVRGVPESAESPSSDAVVHREESVPPSRARRIDINVRTALGDDVEFSGFGITTGLEGAVQIRGGNQAVFTGQGRLSLREGRYKAYGQELEIDRGELIFNGPLQNPRLNIRAVRRISDVTAGIEVSGFPTQLQSTVFSDPAMSDADALSYLLTGRPLASATSTGDGNTLNNAAFALGISGAGNITSQVRNQLGLETLTIQGGVDDSQLIAGKRFGDRLLIEYGYGLIDQLGTLLLRYQLSDRIVLESRTGSVSNLDIVYSVKKK